MKIAMNKQGESKGKAVNQQGVSKEGYFFHALKMSVLWIIPLQNTVICNEKIAIVPLKIPALFLFFDS